MKNIDIKSLLIGFLMCSCLVMLTAWGRPGMAGTYVIVVDDGSIEGIMDTRNGDIFIPNSGWKNEDTREEWTRAVGGFKK